MVIDVQHIKVEYPVGNFANRGLKDYVIRLFKHQNVKEFRRIRKAASCPTGRKITSRNLQFVTKTAHCK